MNEQSASGDARHAAIGEIIEGRGARGRYFITHVTGTTAKTDLPVAACAYMALYALPDGFHSRFTSWKGSHEDLVGWMVALALRQMTLPDDPSSIQPSAQYLPQLARALLGGQSILPTAFVLFAARAEDGETVVSFYCLAELDAPTMFAALKATAYEERF